MKLQIFLMIEVLVLSIGIIFFEKNVTLILPKMQRTSLHR